MSKDTVQVANEPIYTRGNWFWRNGERFLIKGISYIPRTFGGDSQGPPSNLDPLDESRLDDLRRDIPILQELGLNTVQVTALKPGKDYSKAMHLLANAGIYVLVTLFEDFQAPDHTVETGANLDTAALYTTDLLKPALEIVDALADDPNLLGFVVAVEAINRPDITKLAELYRAAIRDIKLWLHDRGSRIPPVGASINDIAMLKRPLLEYFTAGAVHSRADFFGTDNWGWCHRSSFQVSGWKNNVEASAAYPVPMYLSAFGARTGKKRLWEEVRCLYSPDMTGVFSGGCAYTFLECGNGYGVVRARGREVVRKEEFERLSERFGIVNRRAQGEVFREECKDYEGWEGAFPETGERWHAKAVLPQVSGGLESLMLELKDEKEWLLISADEINDRGDANDEAVEGLAENVDQMAISKGS